jgi:hypothetical protein
MSNLGEKLVASKLFTEQEINKVQSYIAAAQREEKAAQARKSDAKTPVSNNSEDQLYTLAVKYKNLGLLVDGVNVVITGVNMAMVTFNGYKNKVLSVYPETEFDIQLVREGDTFHFAKESGGVIYSHEMADPFSTTDAKIIGAYVVFKNKRGEFLETLNRSDYEKMKKSSRQEYLWGQWESEFWLKSVIKRACKRHFFDVVAEIDKNDNEDYGINIDKNPEETDEAKAARIEEVVKLLGEAPDMAALKAVFIASNMMQEPAVVAAKDARKGELTERSKDVEA